MDTWEDLYSQAEEAEEALETHLTEEEHARLREIYHSVTKQIRWDQVLDNAFPLVLELMGEMMEDASPELCKNDSPWYDVTVDDRGLFDEEEPKAMARRHVFLLWLTKKLLGGLKTRANKGLGDIQVLTPEEEEEFMATIEAFDAADQQLDAVEELDADFARYVADGTPQRTGVPPGDGCAEARRLLNARQAGVTSAYDDDEVEEVRQRKKPEAIIHSRHQAPAGPERRELPAVVEIGPVGDCRQSGRHVRTTVRWKKKNDEMFAETYCKDCRQVVRTVKAIQSKERIVDPKTCRHPGAEWVEGKEGQEAICTLCEGPIPNPETYRWIQAGLEPFDDDPTQDEAITLCSDY